MARMPRAKVFVGWPKEKPSGDRFVIDFHHSDAETQIAKDVVDGLRERGYDVKMTIEREVLEEY